MGDPKKVMLKKNKLFEKVKIEDIHKICDFCYKKVGKVYSWAISHTTTTVSLCKECIEKETSMTVEELFRPVPIEIHHNLDGTRTVIKP